MVVEELVLMVTWKGFSYTCSMARRPYSVKS